MSITPSPSDTQAWLSAEETRILRDSFMRVIPVSEQASQALYTRLFEIAPSLRSMFPADLVLQQEKLVLMLGMTLDLLDDPKGLGAACKELGERHRGYGALPEHYPIVGRLLVEEFGRAAQPPFSEVENRLWSDLYDRVAAAMLSVSED